jgi:hypothetical protein
VLNSNSFLSQIVYSESFNTLSVTTATNTVNHTQFLYGDVPNTMSTINTGNLIADTLTGNYPFRITAQKQKAWLAYSPSNTTDTFAVSTSWLKPQSVADSWLITPIINNITANTVLTWEAMAPDAANADGYDVYVSTSNNPVPVTSDFTTNIYTVVSEKYTWQKRGVSLSAFAGQSIRIAFRNSSNNKYQLWLDDIKVETITNGFDVTALSYNTYKYSTPNSNNSILATFKNTGATAITSLMLNYQVGNAPVVSELKVLSTALNYLDKKEFSFSVPFISSQAAYFPVSVWVSQINGQADQLHANDTVKGGITLSSAMPQKTVLLETYTGTHFGWEPEAYEMLKTIAVTNTNVVIATLHSNDNMATLTTNVIVNDYAKEFPSATVDQYYFEADDKLNLDRFNWSTYINKRKNVVVPASVSVTAVSYNATSNEISATVSSTFFGDVKGDYRLNIYVKENNVYGDTADVTDNGWNQYSFLHNVFSSPYYQKGTYLNASTYLLNGNDYKHQHVIHDMLGGAYGTAGIIPLNGSTNAQTYSTAYTYTLPTTVANEFAYHADNIYLIGVVSEYNADTKQRTILNSTEVKLNTNPEVVVGLKESIKNTISLSLFPNPATDYCYVNYTTNNTQTASVKMYNILGEMVYSDVLHIQKGNGVSAINTSALQAGAYTVTLLINGQLVSKKLTIIK